MANRVCLGQHPTRGYGLFVSKPGQDVLTAPQSGLNFNSAYAAMPYEIQATHAIVWTTITTTTGGITGGNTFVSFGKTFPTPPFVIFERVVSGTPRGLGVIGGFYHGKSVQDEFGSQIASLDIQATVVANGINLAGSYAKRRSGVTTPSFSFRYTVYGYNI